MPQRRDIIVIGASAGGVEVLTSIAATLQPDLPAAIFVVLHLPATHRSYLPEILNRVSPLPARHAEDGADIEHGFIYVAPPDFHLLIGGGTMHVARGPRVNRSRPSIDLLFQSASAAHGPRVVGIIGSGMLDDGTRGLATIKRRGGHAIVQDPDEASFDGMPRNALANVDVDRVLPATEIGPALNALVTERLELEEVMPERPRTTMLDSTRSSPANTRDISPYTCPDCNGMLWEIEEGSLVHYHCRVGHSFTPSALIASQVDEVEALLWSALRAMEERESMYRKLLARGEKFDSPIYKGSLQNKMKATAEHAELLRRILLGEETITGESAEKTHAG